MRLTCPACETAYELPDDAVPEGGRWVRCSACRAEWLARPSLAVARASIEAATAAEPAPQTETAPPAETAPPTGFEPARPGPSLGATLREEGAPQPHAPEPAARRPADRALAASIADEDERSGGGGGRSMALIALVTFVALIAVVAYVRHDAIAEAAPQLRDPLMRYVEWVDGMRAAIREAARGGNGA